MPGKTRRHRHNALGSQSSSSGASQIVAGQPERHDRGNTSFVKQATMASLYSQHDEMRKNREEQARHHFLGDPPTDASLIQANLVLPGKHLLPRELQNPKALDHIRERHGVWIVQLQPNILEVHCQYMNHLKEAMADINKAIHDMRISNQKSYIQFVTQIPVRASKQCPVIVAKGCRPYVEKLGRPSVDPENVIIDLMQQLQPSFLQSTDAIMSRKESISMNVQFGRFIAKGRKKDLGDQMSFEDLVGMVAQYAAIGQAKLALFDGNLTKALTATEELQHLQSTRSGIFNGHEEIEHKIDITLCMGDKQLSAELKHLTHGQPMWSNIRVKRAGARTALQWTVVAPDRKYDWQLRVDAWEAVSDIPAEVMRLLTSVEVINFIACQQPVTEMPIIRFKGPDNGRDVVDQTILSVSTTVPFRDTPFVVQVSTIYTWQGRDLQDEPQVSYTTKMYGIHWEDALNYVPSGKVKKDWGDEQEHIWFGTGPTAEQRFAEFLRHVLDVLTALEDA